MHSVCNKKKNKPSVKAQLTFSFVGFGYMFRTKSIFRPLYKTHSRNNNINSQLDATIIILLIISISWTCFGRKSRPSSGELDCVYSLWYKAPAMLPAGDQQAASPVLYTTSCKHSLVLLRMGETVARIMLNWLKLLIKLLLLHLVGCLYYYISDARSHKYQSRYNVTTCQHTVLSLCLLRHPTSHLTFH